MLNIINFISCNNYFCQNIDIKKYPANLSLFRENLKYRSDIDGLRAIAILAVVLFHAFPDKIPGGFVGVDIFFVISGFLISTIIFLNLEQNDFSLIEFYIRRIRRIFPALILVLVFCLVLGWYVLFPDEYTQLGKHTAAGAGFIQNFILLRESGYFDNSSETKPLLQLWSLAVEEQFYFFWPILLALAWKRNWSFLKLIISISVVSFVTNIYLISSGRTMASFYLPFPRFWELMIGGQAAYILLYRPQLIEKYKNVQSLLGFILIFTGLIFLNREKNFPGFWALLPAMGTFFLISAGPASWLNNKLLTNKLMIWIGLISYPLYLWHWSMLSFLHIIEGKAASSALRIIVICNAILFAWLTYRFIEKPIRSSKISKRNCARLSATMIVICLVGVINYKSNIFKMSNEKTDYIAYFDNSLPKMIYSTREKIFEKYRSDCDFYDLEKHRMGRATFVPKAMINKSCFTRISSYSHAVLLWGDSHVQQLYYGLMHHLPNNWQILLGVSSGCAANVDITGPSKNNYCDQSNWKTLETIKTEPPDVVIIGQVSGHSISKMILVASKLKIMGVKKIIFTGPVPQWDPPLYKVIAKNLWKNTPRHTLIGINQEIIKLNNQLLSGFKSTNDILFIDLINFFCNKQGCLTYIGKDKKQGITTFDYGHLTPIASNKLAKELLVNKIIS